MLRVFMVIILVGMMVGCDDRTVSVSETPLKILKEKSGAGRVAAAGDLVTISYRLEFPDGKVLLKDDDYSFELGANAVIKGIDEAVTGMQVGGMREVVIPPQKHWGRNGYAKGKVPPNTILTLRVKLRGAK